MKFRLHKALKIAAALLITGSAYAIFVLNTGLYIPCVFYKLTGLQCPGCGVTRMCLAVLRLNFKDAFEYNPGLFAALPFLAALLSGLTVKYIKTGNMNLGKRENAFVWIMAIYFVIWSIVRNLY